MLDLLSPAWDETTALRFPHLPDLTLKDAVGRAHGSRDGRQTCPSERDQQFFEAYAEITVTNPAEPGRGSAHVADQGPGRDSGGVGAVSDVSPGGPIAYRHRLGVDLRRLREAHGLRLEDAAARLGLVPSTLSRIETGQAPIRIHYLAVLLDLYGVDDADQLAHHQPQSSCAWPGGAGASDQPGGCAAIVLRLLHASSRYVPGR